MHRLLIGALLLYLASDYCDPSIPGVFWFDTESFFVDAAVAQRGVVTGGGATVHTSPSLAFDRHIDRSHKESACPISETRSSLPAVPRIVARGIDLPVKTPVAED